MSRAATSRRAATLTVLGFVLAMPLVGCAKPGEQNDAGKSAQAQKGGHKSARPSAPKLPFGGHKPELVKAEVASPCLTAASGGLAEAGEATVANGNEDGPVGVRSFGLSFPSDTAAEKYGRDENAGASYEEEDAWAQSQVGNDPSSEPEYVAHDLAAYVFGDEDSAIAYADELGGSPDAGLPQRRQNVVIATTDSGTTTAQDELLDECLPPDTRAADGERGEK